MAALSENALKDTNVSGHVSGPILTLVLMAAASSKAARLRLVKNAATEGWAIAYMHNFFLFVIAAWLFFFYWHVGG